jgi:hypothetical protein
MAAVAGPGDEGSELPDLRLTQSAGVERVVEHDDEQLNRTPLAVLAASASKIARLKQLRSPFGAYLDAVVDRYADTAMLAAATVYAWRAGGGWAFRGSQGP